MKEFKNLLLMFGFVFAMTLGSQAIAQVAPPGTVSSDEEAMAVAEQRSDFMKGLGGAMKAFSNYVKRGDGDPEELAARAGNIADNASSIPDLFPVDTGMGRFEESEAKAVIWQDWEDFVSKTGPLQERALALQAAFQSGDKDKIGGALKALGGEGCRGCHKKFREKKN